MRRVIALAVRSAGCHRAARGLRGEPPTPGRRAHSSASAVQPVTGTINVFAAASLHDAFTTLGKQFEAANPGTKVVFNFGPSSGLAEQIGQGAPADVFASASTSTMDEVVDRR